MQTAAFEVGYFHKKWKLNSGPTNERKREGERDREKLCALLSYTINIFSVDFYRRSTNYANRRMETSTIMKCYTFIIYKINNGREMAGQQHFVWPKLMINKNRNIGKQYMEITHTRVQIVFLSFVVFLLLLLLVVVCLDELHYTTNSI